MSYMTQNKKNLKKFSRVRTHYGLEIIFNLSILFASLSVRITTYLRQWQDLLTELSHAAKKY